MDLARARLLVARADQAKKKSKGTKAANKEDENLPEGRKGPFQSRMLHVTFENDVADVLTLGGLRKTPTTSLTSSSP